MENLNMEKDTNIVPEEQGQAVNTIEITEESKKKTLSFAKKTRIIGCILIGFLVIGCITYLWRPLNLEDESFDSSLGNIIYSSSNDDNTYLSCPDDNHPHMIDLGLPSGTKWACCNVGASSPKDYGGYYAWGEINEKTEYNWNTYIHTEGSKKTCYNLGSDIAGTKYDVAHVKWGGGWHMPTLTQIQELIDNTTSEWTSKNGIVGSMFTGSNGSTIFLPAAGRRGSEPDLTGSLGYYWSSTPREYGKCYAYDLYFHLYGARWNYDDYRYYGLSVRPVAP